MGILWFNGCIVFALKFPKSIIISAWERISVFKSFFAYKLPDDFSIGFQQDVTIDRHTIRVLICAVNICGTCKLFNHYKHERKQCKRMTTELSVLR